MSITRTLVIALLSCASSFACSPKERVQVPTVTTGGGEGDLQIAELGSCALESGEKIEECRIGYRTYGKLDAAKSNLVLWPTWFTGKTENLVSGVPNKLVDTKRFFLVLVEAIGNGVSSSPSTSRTQPRLRFPVFTIHDMVESQRRLVREVFGVKKLHAAMGISMGGMQAYAWAVMHPDEVERIVPIVGTPRLTAQDLLLWNAEMHLLDDSKAYANGEYRERPKIPALQELHWLHLTTPAQRNAETSRHDYAAWAAAKASDTAFDWNDWHRQLEAMIAHDVARGGDLEAAARRVKARGLVIVAERDQMVNPEPSKIFARAMGAELVVLDSPLGHMVPGSDPTVDAKVRAFLER